MATFHDVIVFAPGRRGWGAKKIVRYEGRGLVLYGDGKLGKTALCKAICAKMGWRYIFTNSLDALRGANIPKGKMGKRELTYPKSLGGAANRIARFPYMSAARFRLVRVYTQSGNI